MKYEVLMFIKNDWHQIIESEDINSIKTVISVLNTTHPNNKVKINEIPLISKNNKIYQKK